MFYIQVVHVTNMITWQLVKAHYVQLVCIWRNCTPWSAFLLLLLEVDCNIPNFECVTVLY